MKLLYEVEARGSDLETAVRFFPCERSSVHPAHHQLARELLDSDAEYFRAAANCELIAGCQVVHMPGLESLAAGCLVQNLTPALSLDFPFWLKNLEDRLLSLSSSHARFYQQYPDQRLEQCFLEHGYRRAEEIALLNVFETTSNHANESAEVTMHAVSSDQDWRIKLELHQETAEDPDGHLSPAAQWLDMERRKCAAGYMQAFLIYCGGDVCGSVNLSLGDQLGRLKNLVVHPGWRRKGIGAQAARLIAHLAQDYGMAAAGCFAINYGPSLALYQMAGYVPVTRQIEWYRDLR
jgi:GNAT superfamily N-acetyltransferase